MKQYLIDAVLMQIETDVKNGDLTAIEELIKNVDDLSLVNFLSEQLD